uniref:HD domain-containing protein n=1 Tax=Paenibacillus sp. IHBB 3054 TaxID=3425689 RepID=UPI003F67E706
MEYFEFREERVDKSPEIALLVFSSFFHDLGMALNKEEREVRLRALWDNMTITERNQYQHMINETQITREDSSEQFIALQRLTSAQEAMLCLDTRERHGNRERYNELICMLHNFHQKNPSSIINIYSALNYQGDSFLDILVEICVSHNEPAEVLAQFSMLNPGRLRFPIDYPIGGCKVNLQLVAAALRLSDILDFDRERTPNVLFHYLLPQSSLSYLNRSYLEWGKHLSISNWSINEEAINYNGHCYDHVIHHTLSQFCEDIQNEIKSTKRTFTEVKEEWPFCLPLTVNCNIIEHGYKYTPYTFEADMDKVYQLFMGKSIYNEPIHSIRELVQNAVDACKL